MKGGTDENEKNRHAHRTAVGVECLLPVLAQDARKSENKRAGPKNGTGAGNQDEGTGIFYRHVDSLINTEFVLLYQGVYHDAGIWANIDPLL